MASRGTFHPALKHPPRRWRQIAAGSLAAAAVVTGLAVATSPAAAVGETLDVRVVDQLDGAAPFTPADVPGGDTGDRNGIVRTNDNITFQVEVSVNDAAASEVTFVLPLPQGVEMSAVPAYCTGPGSALSPASLGGPVLPVTAASYTALPVQTLTCNVGPRASGSTQTYPVVAKVRPEAPHGAQLSAQTVSVTSADVPTPVTDETAPLTVSARAQFDVSKNSTSLTENSGYLYTDNRPCADNSGRTCFQYLIPVLMSAPAGGKGVTPLADPVTFTDDLSPASLYGPSVAALIGADVARYGAILGGCAPTNYMSPAQYIGWAGSTEANAVRDSGTTTCTQPGGPGTPVSITISGLDSTAYTVPNRAAEPPNTTLPADRGYVYSYGIVMQIPQETVRQFGTPNPQNTQFTLPWDNRITGFAPVGIDGTVNDPAANLAFNDHRASTSVISSGVGFAKHFVGVPGAVGNTPPNVFNPGDANRWNGPAGSTGPSNGDGQLFPGARTISNLAITAATVSSQESTTMLMCDSWDSTRLQLDGNGFPAGATGGQRFPGPAGQPVWVAGYQSNGVQFPGSEQAAPSITVEYGAGSDFGPQVDCDANEAGGGWFADPADVPGNDPQLLAEGIYSGVSKVRVYVTIPPAAAGPVATIDIAIGQRAVPTLENGTILPNFAKIKSAAFRAQGVAPPTYAEMLAANRPWAAGNYDPATNTGDYGDRLFISTAVARLLKEVRDPGTGQFVTSTPAYTGGQTVDYRLTPTLTAGVQTDITLPTVLEDCLPVGEVLLASRLAGQDITPSVAQVGSPAGAGLTCGAGETYVLWDLGSQPINAPIGPLEYSVRVAAAAQAGTKVNTAMVTAVGDGSAPNLRMSTASIQVVQPAGILIDKRPLTPVVEVNRAEEAAKDPLLWSIDFVNIESSPGPTDPDIIDVLPRNGANGSDFAGDYVFDRATVTAGDVPGQPVEILYTAAAAPALDPADPSNAATGSTVWCSAPSGGAVVLGGGSAQECPDDAADVTGLRIRRDGAFGPSAQISVEVGIVPSGNAGGDVYVNSVQGRAAGLALPVGPVNQPQEIIASSIGDVVWLDADADGVQDDGEPGVPGFPVSLTGTDTDGNAVSLSTTTDANGRYAFAGLQSGTYTVTFSPEGLADGRTFTVQNALGADAALDSNGNVTTGASAPIVLGANASDPTVDQGIVPAPAQLTFDKQLAGTPTQDPDGTWTVSYDLVVANGGESAGVYSLTDTLRYGAGVAVDAVSVASTSPTGLPTNRGFDGRTDTTVITGQSIAGGATHTYRVTVTAAVDADRLTEDSADCLLGEEPGTGFLNTATLTSGQTVLNGSACAPAGAVRAEKSADPADGSVVREGQTLTYTLTFTHVGAAGASTEYTDHLAGVLDDATLVSGPTVTGPGTVTALEDGAFTYRGALADGQVATVTYVVQVLPFAQQGDHDLVNFLAERGEEPGGQCAAGDPLCTEHPVGQVLAAKTVDPEDGSTVGDGDTVTYTVTFTHQGVAPAEASYTDVLAGVLDDAALDADPVLTGPGTLERAPAEDGGGFTWSGTLAPGEVATVVYSVTVLPYAQQGDHALDNVVVVTGEEPGDECLAGDPLCTHNPTGLVVYSKTAATSGPVTAGAPVTYTITARNSSDAATAGQFADDLSAVLDDASFDGTVTASAGLATYAAPVISWAGTLAPGETATITYTVIVKAGGDGALRNVVVSDTPGSNCATGSGAADCVAVLAVPPAPAAPPAQLAVTGAEGAQHLRLGLGVLALGLALMAAAGRRRAVRD